MNLNAQDTTRAGTPKRLLRLATALVKAMVLDPGEVFTTTRL